MGAQPPDDVVQAVLKPLGDSLVRRGYLTTEWWTTVIGGALSAVLALVHLNASSATHVVAVAAPALLAALYALTRTRQKSNVASALSDVFPQAVAGGVASQPAAAGGASLPAGQLAQTAQPLAQQDQPGAQTTQTVGAQTDPDFAFEGIPPIEETDG